MELRNFSLEDLFFTAMKAEVDSREAYSIMAGITRNAFLKDRLRFLADEEEKHREFLESEFRTQFPETEILLPEVSPVPLPGIDIKSEGIPMTELLQQAMDAEKAAQEFYMDFAKYVGTSPFAVTLGYFARMEEGHYELLKREKAAEDEFETYDDFNPAMHLGP